MGKRESESKPGLRWLRGAAIAALLSAASAVQGQPVFPIPLAAAAFAPLLVPLVLIFAWETSGAGITREARVAFDDKNWPRVVQIANRELHRRAEARERHPQDEVSGPERATEQQWLLMRAYAYQRVGRYAEARDDYRAATAGVETPNVGVELNLGICHMALGRWSEAEHLMLRIAEREPQRWEPHYNLGVIRSISGDAVGARIALDRLRPLNDLMASALETQYVRRLAESKDAARFEAGRDARENVVAGQVLAAIERLPALSSTDLGAVSAPGRLPEARLTINKRTVDLAPGQWVLASRREYRVSGTFAGTYPQVAGWVFRPNVTAESGAT